MKLLHKAIGFALLFFSFAVQAAYVLVTASGHVIDAVDQTGYLGYGIGRTYQGAMPSILGKPIIVSYLIDTDLSGPDNRAGEDLPFNLDYYDHCADPSAPYFTQLLGFTLNGQLLPNFAASLPSNTHCSYVQLEEQGGRLTSSGAYDRFLVMAQDTGISQGVLDDGSTITKTSGVRSVTRVEGPDYDFFNGFELDQSFVWTAQPGPRLWDGGIFEAYTSLENCVGTSCAVANLNSFSLTYHVDFLLAQAFPKPVPEPTALLLLGLGLCCVRLRCVGAVLVTTPVARLVCVREQNLSRGAGRPHR